LLEPVDRRLQHNSFCAQLAFFGGVVGLERHVEIKCGRRQIEDGCVGRVRKRYECPENQDVDRRLDKFANVDGADAGNKAERKSRSGLVPPTSVSWT
jgi:hypothetical protein